MEMLELRDPEDVAEAERILKAVGPPAVALLLNHATTTRFKVESRLKFLRLAQAIGVTYDQDNCVWLRKLIEGRSKKVADLAKAILFEISPHGSDRCIALCDVPLF